jgi:hypothetical protein
MAGVVSAVGAVGWPLAGCSPAGWSSPLSAHAGGEPTNNIAQAVGAQEIILLFMGRPFLGEFPGLPQMMLATPVTDRR